MMQFALIFVFGAWCLQQMSDLPPLAWLAGALPLLAIFYRRKAFPEVIQKILVVLLAFSAGFLWASSMAHWRLADELPTAWEQKNITIVGVVAEMPRTLPNGMRFIFDVEQVLTEGAKVPSRISLSHYAPDAFKQTTHAQGNKFNAVQSQSDKPAVVDVPHYRAGERWQLQVRLKRPHSTYNPHGVDFEAWALERNIRATGHIKAQAQVKRLCALVWQPTYIVERLRQSVAERIQRVLGQQTNVSILQALAVGDDDAIAREDWQVFLNTGTNHLMSISGLHITMLSGLVFALVLAAWRRSAWLCLRLPARKAATLLALLAATAYALLAGFSVPTQRTLYMLAVFAYALLINRSVVISQVLACALLVVVVMDPWAVISPGFWLSFGAVAVLAYALGARVGRAAWGLEAVRAQWAVTAGLVPSLILMFGQVSLISPIANALAIPLISLAVVPITLLGALTPLDWPLQLAHSVLAYTMQMLTWMASLPLAQWQQAAPPMWAVLCGLVGVLYMLLPKGVPLRVVALLACLSMFLVRPEPVPLGGMQVVVLDVGQGLAVLIQTRHHAMLYDTGPQYSPESDAGAKVVLPYLRSVGVKRLDGVMLSHNDNDHTGGFASIKTSLPLAWVASSWLRNQSTSPQHKTWICRQGQYWIWDGVRFDVLHPGDSSGNVPRSAVENAGVKNADNNASCVLKVTSENGALLLTGDIEQEAEQALLTGKARDALSADVLLIPHHGSKTSSTAAFVDAVQPSFAIATTGYRNRFRHPRQEVMDRYTAHGSLLYQSDQSGAVLLDFTKPAAIEVTQWRAFARRYWHDNYD